MNKQYQNAARLPGHWLRRFVHIATVLTPVIYYWYLPDIALRLEKNPQSIVFVTMVLVLLFEGMRLLFGFKVYGERQYESSSISSAALAFICIGIVLLLAPRVGLHGAGFGLPLICSFSIADPLMGELRIQRCPRFFVTLSGLLTVSAIWVGGMFFLATPGWVIPLMVPIMVLTENYLSRWFDDNAGMLLLPLFFLLFYQYI